MICFFHFIDLAERLKPKVIISENVKGMLMGNAKGYVKQIIKRYESIGYNVQLYLLNGATMGASSKETTHIFLFVEDKDLNLKDLKLDFKEKPISVKEALG